MEHSFEFPNPASQDVKEETNECKEEMSLVAEEDEPTCPAEIKELLRVFHKPQNK